MKVSWVEAEKNLFFHPLLLHPLGEGKDDHANSG
jgi:hypothetical protein